MLIMNQIHVCMYLVMCNIYNMLLSASFFCLYFSVLIFYFASWWISLLICRIYLANSVVSSSLSTYSCKLELLMVLLLHMLLALVIFGMHFGLLPLAAVFVTPILRFCRLFANFRFKLSGVFALRSLTTSCIPWWLVLLNFRIGSVFFAIGIHSLGISRYVVSVISIRLFCRSIRDTSVIHGLLVRWLFEPPMLNFSDPIPLYRDSIEYVRSGRI